MAIVLAVLVGILYSTYDMARLTAAKIQSQDAADAAALAAVSVKVSIHNTRTLAYAAMTAEATLARLRIAKAVAILASYPAGPGAAAAEVQVTSYIKKADGHLKKLKELRDTLDAYNHWVAQAAPQIVSEAARIGYAANIAGMNDDSGAGATANETNMQLMDGDQNLVENGGTFKSGQFIGGINYRSESAGSSGDAGKTFVWVEPRYMPLGSGLLGGLGAMTLPALAAAGPASSSQIAKADPKDGDMAIDGFGLPWYSPRLFAIGGLHGYPNAILH